MRSGSLTGTGCIGYIVYGRSEAQIAEPASTQPIGSAPHSNRNDGASRTKCMAYSHHASDPCVEGDLQIGQMLAAALRLLPSLSHFPLRLLPRHVPRELKRARHRTDLAHARDRREVAGADAAAFGLEDSIHLFHSSFHFPESKSIYRRPEFGRSSNC